MFYRFTLPADYSKQIFTDKIKAVSYTEFENEPSLVHSHKNVTEVIFVKSGEGSIAYRDIETEIKPNTIYFVNPNTDHTEISKSNLSYFVVHLSDFVVSDKDKIPIKSLEVGQKEYREIIGLLSLAMDEIKSPKNTAFKLLLFRFSNRFYVRLRLVCLFFKGIQKKPRLIAVRFPRKQFAIIKASNLKNPPISRLSAVFYFCQSSAAASKIAFHTISVHHQCSLGVITNLQLFSAL